MNWAEWARCRAWILPALRDATEAELLEELAAGRAQLWPGKRSAIVSTLRGGAEPFILLWLAGGDLSEIVAMAPGMEAWSRAQGAIAARINGRRGWRRALASSGWELDGGDLKKVL